MKFRKQKQGPIFRLVLAGSVAILSIFVYCRTLLPSVAFSDVAELQTVAATLGIAHPTGYPLYTLLGKLFTFLPLKSLAWRVNFMSAFFAALTVLLTFLAIDFLARDFLAALIGSLSLAFSPNFWSFALVAEMYSLNVFLATALTLLLLLWQKSKKENFLLCFSLIYGLSWGNHTGIIILAPIFALFILLNLPGEREILKKLGLPLLLFLTGLLVYLYLPLRDVTNPPLNYNNPSTLTNFVKHVTAREFNRLMFTVPIGELPGRIRSFFVLAKEQFLVIEWVLAIVGILSLVFAKKIKMLVLFLGIVAMEAFVWLEYAVPDFHRYITPIFLITVLFIGIGTAAVRVQLQKVFGPTLTSVLCFTLLVVPILKLKTNYQEVDQSKNTAAKIYGEKVMSALPQNAIVCSWWSYSAVLWYFHYAEGLRGDITIVHGGPSDWIPKIEKNLKKRPIYVVDYAREIQEKYISRREGDVWKIVSKR